MRVGLVLAAVPGYSETFFRSKIHGLKEQGHEVIVFASGSAQGFNLCVYVEGAKGDGRLVSVLTLFIALFKLFFLKPGRMIHFYYLEKKSGRSIKQALTHLLFSSHIMRFDLDWLHFGFGTMAIGRENLAQTIGARMAISHRGYDLTIYPLKFPDCYKLAWERADKIHVLSEALKEKAYAFGLSTSKTVIKISPAIDFNKFKNVEKTSSLNAPIKILTVARLKWVKGLDYTLQALAILKERGIEFHYILIGEGEEYERLLFTAHQLGISAYVSFAGKKAPEEVKKAMEETDIYLQYSISEGFCNAVLEAQAMGCLCVVSDAEGLPENVVHEETGWVVPKRRPDLLAAQIIEILGRSEDMLNKVQTQAITRVHDEFGLEKQIQAFAEFYQG